MYVSELYLTSNVSFKSNKIEEIEYVVVGLLSDSASSTCYRQCDLHLNTILSVIEVGSSI